MSDMALYGGATLVVILIGIAIWLLLNSERMATASLFNRLFIVVAVTSAFFSAISSAIGFGLITSQETVDFFRNSVLPPAFGLFVFFIAIAIWVGGAELVRNRDWFRAMEHYTGPMALVGDFFFFIERAVKLFVIVPILAAILFLVSTWTSVVGIAGVDAVRYTYSDELSRLQTDCNGIIAYRRNDILFLDDLTLAISDVKRAARREQDYGGQTGLRGRGAATDYIDGVAEWLSALEVSARTLIDRGDENTAYSP